MREKAYKTITSFIMRWWLAILIVSSVAAYFCYAPTSYLFHHISTDLIKLLPPHYTSVKTLEQIRTKFEGAANLAIILESDNPEATRKLLLFLADKFQKDPAVRKVIYEKTGYNFFDKHKLLFLDIDDLQTIHDRIDRRIQKEKLGSFYIDFEEDASEDKEFKFGDIESKYKTRYSTGARSNYITDDEGKIYTMSILKSDPSESLSALEKFDSYMTSEMNKIDITSFDPTMKIYYGGSIRGRLNDYRTLIDDLQFAGLVSGIGIFLALAVYFRRPLAAAIIFIPLAVGVFYSFAFTSIFIANLNIVTSFLFAILGGLGVEVGIHMFARYSEERSAGSSMEHSIFVILFHTGRSAITSGLTVAATFLVLMVNDFKGFSEFGFITGCGIVIVYLAYHVIFPPIIIASEKLRLLKFKHHKEAEHAVSGKSFPFSRTVIITTILLFCFSAFGLSKADFEYNFGKLNANVEAGKISGEKLHKTMPSVNRPAIVLIKNLDEALAIKKHIHDTIQEDEDAKRPAVIDQYKSWYDIIQYNQDEKLVIINDIKRLLADKTIKLVKGEHKKDLDRFKEVLNETKPIAPGEAPDEVKEIFFGNNPSDDYQVSYINAEPSMELADGRNAIAFAERIENMNTPIGTFHASSDAIVFADVLRTMLGDVPRVVILSFAMVFLFVFLDFRNFKKAALVMSPIILGVVLMFGFMYIFEMKLNFYNMIVVPTVFGTSIDNSIHIYHRFEEMGKTRLMKVLKTSGGAALMSSITNIFGFLGLVFAQHLGLASIGKLAIVGMGACLFTTLVYFPAMLQWLGDRKIAGS